MTAAAVSLKRKRQRDWYAHNREKIKKYRSGQRARNHEKIRNRERAWVARNREKVREYQREWQARNSEKVRDWNRKRYARDYVKIREQNREHHARHPEIRCRHRWVLGRLVKMARDDGTWKLLEQQWNTKQERKNGRRSLR